jgi:hypothetical protein
LNFCSVDLRHARRAAAILVALATLSACANTEDLFVAPGKYAIYNCEELATAGRKAAAREHELKGLMSKAEQGSGGAVVNALAYRSEYLETQGQLKQLEQMALEKRCDTPWRAQSDRSMW